MSGQGDQGSFVARWSRLKRESAQRQKEARAGAVAPERDDRAARAPTDARAADASSGAPFDPATLPPIESIVAGSDIRAFLQEGVPTELARAALRRAWTTDPAICDFIGIAENQWDFTDPAAIPGFGPIEPGSDLRRLVAQALGELPDAPDTVGLAKEDRESASDAGQAAASAPREQEKIDAPDINETAASQDRRTPESRRASASPRRHGGALPR